MTPREITLQILRRWTAPAAPPFLPERTDADFAALSPRDRNFAFDLLTGILRWRGTLDAIIASSLRQPLDSLEHPIRALLWLGTYQLLFQGGTSDYAAVDTTVDLAKKYREIAPAAGLINAVLRNITRLTPTLSPRTDPALSPRTLALDFQTQLNFSENVFLDPRSNPIAHLAQVRSHPAAFVEHLRNIYGQSLAAELLLRNNLRPIITLRNDSATGETSTELTAAGLIPHAHAAHFLIASEGWNPQLEELIRKGNLSPQDPTAALPIRTFAEQFASPPPTRILDLCAGLGTKSIQLARAFPQSQITAADIDSVKLARLQQRADQLKIPNLTTLPAPQIKNQKSKIENLFDLVLLDVPCSNTGVMAKRVQSRWRWPTLDRPALQKLQLQLLAQGAALLAPAGKLIYSTCSVDPAENAQLIQAFLNSTTIPLQLLHQQSTLPSQSSDAKAFHDGGYFAILTHS